MMVQTMAECTDCMRRPMLAPFEEIRLLFITLEFEAGCFSGNGVYAQSQAAALRALGHRVLVIAGCPADCQNAANNDLLQISCPTWNRLDEACSWREFAAGAQVHADVVAAFRPSAVVGVDWHSLPVWRAVSQSIQDKATPFIYLNYRVYTRTATGAAYDFIKAMESASVEAAVSVACLSRSDAAYIREKLTQPRQPQRLTASQAAVQTKGIRHEGEQLQSRAGGSDGPFVLLPSLRADMASILPPQLSELKTENDTAAMHAIPERQYLTCCVRLSREKEADRFVAAVECLAQIAPIDNTSETYTPATATDQQKPISRLEQLQLVPLLVGMAATSYACELQERLLKCAPNAVLKTHFMGASDLAQVFAATKLNVHPCCYDAFGMTAVEAASQCAPSLLMGGGAVGATDLLRSSHQESFATDMSAPPSQLADEIERLVLDESTLNDVGARAMLRAREWTQAANADALMAVVTRAIVSTAQ